MEALSRRAEVIHISIRPREEGGKYDRRYYADNLGKASTTVWEPGVPDSTFVEGKLEDNDKEYPNDRVYYIEHDFHYYAADHVRAN
jgi:hypothetical protein